VAVFVDDDSTREFFSAIDRTFYRVSRLICYCLFMYVYLLQIEKKPVVDREKRKQNNDTVDNDKLDKSPSKILAERRYCR
jgi:hypothetical protein